MRISHLLFALTQITHDLFYFTIHFSPKRVDEARVASPRVISSAMNHISRIHSIYTLFIAHWWTATSLICHQFIASKDNKFNESIVHIWQKRMKMPRIGSISYLKMLFIVFFEKYLIWMQTCLSRNLYYLSLQYFAIKNQRHLIERIDSGMLIIVIFTHVCCTRVFLHL